MTTRRNIILGAGLLCLGGYSYQRGVRLPTLHWDPLAISNDFRVASAENVFGTDLIQTPTKNGLSANFRAFAPQPSLNLRLGSTENVTISITNMAPEAELHYQPTNAKVSQVINKTTRILSLNGAIGSQVSLQWQLPKVDDYTFASIGDTGGDKELSWCIERAHALGAKFLLHLGDFNYQESDYQRSIDAFNNAPLPVYVSIGNHDFHDDGALYSRFMREIGPLNNAFSIGKTRFVNIDTAANILPYGAGTRGEMFALMAKDNTYTDTVAFTHRPLHDPGDDSDHDIGSTGERDWLISALKSVKAKTLLSGHIHIYDRRDFNGIDHIIAGQGLGHQDLIVNYDTSKMILGHVDNNGAVNYTAEPLAMPLDAHCHPRIDPVKHSLRNAEHKALLDILEVACKT